MWLIFKISIYLFKSINLIYSASRVVRFKGLFNRLFREVVCFWSVFSLSLFLGSDCKSNASRSTNVCMGMSVIIIINSILPPLTECYYGTNSGYFWGTTGQFLTSWLSDSLIYWHRPVTNFYLVLFFVCFFMVSVLEKVKVGLLLVCFFLNNLVCFWSVLFKHFWSLL